MFSKIQDIAKCTKLSFEYSVKKQTLNKFKKLEEKKQKISTHSWSLSVPCLGNKPYFQDSFLQEP